MIKREDEKDRMRERIRKSRSIVRKGEEKNKTKERDPVPEKMRTETRGSTITI